MLLQKAAEFLCLTQLESLKQHEMVFQQDESVFQGTKEFHFKHALFRDVTYESLLKRYRKIYHTHAARWLQEVTGRSGRADEYASLIADHFDQAGEALEAAEWYARAAETSAARYANNEAARLISRALDLTPLGNTQSRFDLLIRREQMNHLMGTRDDQKRDLEDLVQLLEVMRAEEGDQHRRAVVEVEWALYFDQTGDYLAAIQHSQKVVEHARNAGIVALEARGHLIWGSAAWHHADYVSAREQDETALALAREAGQFDTQAQSLLNLGIIADALGEFKTGLAFCSQALALYRQIGDLVGESRALNSLGVITFNMNDLTNSHAYYLQSLQIKRLIGNLYGIGVSLNNLGIVARRQFELSTALDYYDQCLQVCEKIDDLEGKSASLSGLGSIYHGDWRLPES